jgi:hypothetical protein
VEHLEEFACTGVPVRHPVTHKVLGVIDLTCWRRDAGSMMAAAASALGRRIEAMLLEHSGRREHALLHDYLTACRRNRDAVLAVGDDLLMLNDRARDLLAPADQGPLLAEIAEALATGRRQQLLVDLPSGLTARVQCKPSFTDGSGTGGVALVQMIGQVSAAAGAPGCARPCCPPPWAPDRCGRSAARPSTGPSVRPSGWCWRASRARGRRRWRGRSTRAARRRRTCGYSTPRSTARAGRGRDRRARDGRGHAAAHPRRHAAARGDVRARRRPRALPRVDRRRRALGRGHHRQATGRPRQRPHDAAHAVPATVEVPPLRHHVEDVAELVRTC